MPTEQDVSLRALGLLMVPAGPGSFITQVPEHRIMGSVDDLQAVWD